MPSKNCGLQKEKIKVDVQTKNPGIFRYRGSESGGYLLSHNIPQCSTIGDAVSLCCPRPSPLRCLPPLPAPLLSALSPAPARRRRAHRRPPRASDALRERYGATRSWDIKDLVSLKKVSLFFERPLGARGYSRACCVLGSLEVMS